MVYHLQHEMLAPQTPDDTARSRFVLAFKRHLVGSIRKANGLAYEVYGEPAFIKEHGHAPANRDEALEALSSTTHYKFWSALNRTSQELMWTTVSESIYRAKKELEDNAARLIKSDKKRGSLNLDPNFKADPAYTDQPIHLQPHGYVLEEETDGDILAGAFYEMGGRLYSMGRGMSARDSKAGSVLAYIESKRPGWTPKRVLDMGCSAGGGSVPYAEAFPDAEVHAIDLGASMLRYAHARAEAMGQTVHFHQMDAGKTTFPDGYFDLIISHNLFHEISTEKRKEIAKETLRLLSPDGLAIHQDVDLLFHGKKLWEQAERSWDFYHNNEHFWIEYAENDFVSELIEAGFDEELVEETVLSKTAGPGGWQVYVAEKRRPN